MERCCYVFLRLCHDVPIRCREDVPLRRLGDVPPRRRRVFHLRHTCDVVETYREKSLQRHSDVLLPGGFSFIASLFGAKYSAAFYLEYLSFAFRKICCLLNQ